MWIPAIGQALLINCKGQGGDWRAVQVLLASQIQKNPQTFVGKWLKAAYWERESMQPFSGEAKLLPNATKGVHRPLPKEIIFYREHTEGQLRGLIHLYHNTACTSGLSHLKEEIQKSWKR